MLLLFRMDNDDDDDDDDLCVVKYIEILPADINRNYVKCSPSCVKVCIHFLVCLCRNACLILFVFFFSVYGLQCY